MTVAALLERVDREAHTRLMPVLLERAALHHRKGWRDCNCSWCRLKQRATADIANSPLNLHGKDAREERRQRLREHYRPLFEKEFDR